MKLTRTVLWKFFAALAVLLFAALFAFAWSGYLNIKKIVRSELASYATALIGQRVDLRDISLSAVSGLHLHNIAIQNPEGFSNGQLLRIGELVISPDMRALLRGRLHITDITISSPEINLVHDPQGRLNVSEKLREFFSQKSTRTYRVDTLSIRSGIFGLDGRKRFDLSDIDLEMNGISSQKDTRTIIRGRLIHARTNKIMLDGWAYLKDIPRGFALSISSPRFLPASLLSDTASRVPEKSQTALLAGISLAVQLVLKGDPTTGIHISSRVASHDPGSLYSSANAPGKSKTFGLMDGVRVASLDADAFYDIRQQSVVIHDAALQINASPAAHITGVISNLNQKPSYSASIKLNGLDLSSLFIAQAFKISGKITSDNISVRGTFAHIVPSLSGSVRVEGAAFRSGDFDLGNINGDVSLSSASGRTFALNTLISGDVQKIKNVVLKKSSAVKISLSADGTLDAVTLHGSVSLASSSIPVQNGKAVSFGSASLVINSSFLSTGKTDAFLGEGSVIISDFLYDDIHIPSLKASTGFNFARNTFALKSLDLESKEIRCFADKATLGFSADSSDYTAELSGVNISFPAKKTEIKKGVLGISISRKNNALSGNGTFSTGDILFHDNVLGRLSGSCRLDGTNFYLDRIRAALPSGTITLEGQGKVAGGPFPLRMTASAEGLDLDKVAGLYSKFTPFPYVISGKLGKASFDGSMEGTASLHGKAAFEAQNLTVSVKQGKRPVIKDWSLSARIDFKGKDLDFSTDAENKGVSAKASGSIKDFPETKRTAQIKVSVPLIQAAQLREAFWDIFPDSLLYAGLDGAVSSEISFRYDKAGAGAVGTVVFKDLSLSGENGEFEIGPVNGTLPLAYGGEAGRSEETPMPLFERSEFDTLSGEYSRQFAGGGYNRITIGSAGYGFRMLDNITLWVKLNGTAVDIGRFSANIFGGTLSGSAFAAQGRNMSYRIGFLVKGLSLTVLCNDIETIRGYVSGKLDGIAAFKGTGSNLTGLIGKADFWTYRDKNERTKISREFLQKVGGASMKSYMSDRDFDTGILSVYLQKGDIIFNKLEISNRNMLGIKDLSIMVAPYNNRIAIDDLMWSLAQAAHRAKSKNQ
ncbi:MAG: hypothetical protein HQL09_10285 [Nitrospirae bacterium]|nr:hypothetical protein [Nitrospirota bacterium]